MFLGLLVALFYMLAPSNVAAQEVKIFVPEFVCEDVAQIHADMLPDGSVGMWSSPMKSLVFENPTAFATVVTGLQKGSNVVVWTVRDSNGKTSETYAVIEHNGFDPIEAFSMDGDVVCNGECRLYGSLPQSPTSYNRGYWHTETPGVVLSHTAETMITATNLAPGLNRFFWTVSDANGTCYEEAEIVVENAMAHAKIAESTTTETCADSGNLEAEPIEANETGYWSVFSSNVRIQDPNNLKTTFSGLDKGATTFRWTVQNGKCMSFADVEVVNGAIDAIVLNRVEETVCDGEYELRAYLPDQSNVTGLWTSDKSDVVFENPSSTRTMVKNLVQGDNKFSWTVTNGICQYSETIVVHSSPVEATILDETTTTTCNGSGLLSAKTPEPGTVGYWSVLNRSNVILEDTHNPSTKFEGVEHGTTTFRWTVMDSNGICMAMADVDVVNDATDAIILNDDKEVVCGDECELRAYLPDYSSTGMWRAEGNSDVVFENQTFTRTMVRNLAKGDNRFVWTVTNGICEYSSVVTIFNNSVTAKILNNDGEVVNGTECQLQSELSDNAKGYWTTCSSQIVIEKAESNICTVKNLAEGDNCFVWNVISNDGKCSATSELKVVSKGDGKDTPTPVAETTAKVNTHIWSYDKTIVVENGSNEIQISDTNGRILKTIKADSDRTEIPMQKSGIYVVKTAAKSQKVTIR